LFFVVVVVVVRKQKRLHNHTNACEWCQIGSKKEIIINILLCEVLFVEIERGMLHWLSGERVKCCALSLHSIHTFNSQWWKLFL